MSFTDEDLKRLKEALVNITERMEPGDRYLNIEKHQVWGLIDRLEAAERILEWPKGGLGLCCVHKTHERCEYRSLYYKWRKVAGK